jgi:hypothetical protein
MEGGNGQQKGTEMDNGFHAFCALEWKLTDPFWNPECTALALFVLYYTSSAGKMRDGDGEEGDHRCR